LAVGDLTIVGIKVTSGASSACVFSSGLALRDIVGVHVEHGAYFTDRAVVIGFAVYKGRSGLAEVQELA